MMADLTASLSVEMMVDSMAVKMVESTVVMMAVL